MGGDYNYVPIRYGCGTHNTWDYHYSGGIIYDAYKIPADLYFCDFNGDWDVDGTDPDGVIRYGEPFSSTPNYGDNPDYGPEIFVGRLLCSSVDDIINWSEKLILYEQNPGKGDHSYLTRSFMIQSDELQDGNQAGAVDSHLPSAFQPSQIWGEIPSGGAEHPTFPFGYEVINEMNSTRYGLWSWFGHGSPIATVCKSHLYNKDIPTKSYLRAWDDLDIPPAAIEAGNGMDNLNNSSHPAVVYSIACDNTPFDDYHTNYDQRNLGEAFTSMFSGGGPAFLGNTRFGWVGSSYKLYQKFADLLSSGGFNLHLGVAEAVSRYNNSAMKHYLSYSHNLVGCPETKLWTDQPSVYANVSVTDGGTYLTVNTGVAGSTISVCSMDNGQTYSLVADNVSSYTFTTGVRPLYITVTKSNYIPFMAVTGGTITVDVSLYGELLVLGNLTVQNGCTLWVDEGANIAVSENARFTVHGALEVNGTSTNPVIFTSAKGQPSQSDWYGIEITGTASMKYATVEYSDKGIYFNSGSSGTVDHCTAQNNYWGVCVNSANAIIKNSTFTNNRTGIRVYYSYSNPSGSAKHIYDNTIGSNETYGIACYSSAPTFSGNMISGNTRGVYLSSSNCILDHSSTINSNYYGLGCFGTSSPNLYHDGESFGGFNVVTGNGIGGVRIYHSANPYLGFNSSQEPGMNSIYNNNGYEVDNMTSNTIYAAGNWWNNPVSPYGPAPSEINGSVIWSPALSYDPNGGSMLAKSAGGHDVDDESTDIPESLQLAYQDQAKGNYEKAAEAFMEYFLTNYNDPFNEQAAIQYLKSLSYYRTAIEMISDVNQSLKQDIDTDTRFELLSILEIYEGTAEKAVVTLEEAEKAEINKDKQNRINYHKGMIYGYSLNNKSEAENYFTQVVENTAVESEEHFSALDEIDGLRKSAYDGQEATEEPMVISLPLTYNLTQNFPNPFNPLTNFRFELPRDEVVQLTVYNVNGQKIKELINGHRPAGIHEVLFDGSALPSGVYFYRLSTEHYTATKRMLLIK